MEPRPTTVITDDESKAGDDKMTSTMSFRQTRLKPHNAEDKTKESSVTKSFETESTKDLLLSTEHTSELENPATSRKYVNTVTFTKQQMGITTVLTETDCTTELERPSAEHEGSEKKISSGGKEIRPTVEAVQKTTKFGQNHQTSFTGIRLTMAKTTSEKGNGVSDIKQKDEKEYAEQRVDWTATEKLILVTSQPDILMTKELITNKPVTPTTSRGNKHTAMLTEKETGMTTELPETECTTEIELQTPEDKTPVERTHTTYGESSEHLKTKSINELVTSAPSRGHENNDIETEHEAETTTELPETECTREIEMNTPEDKTPVMTTATTYEERQSEPADFISENTESKDTIEPATPTMPTKYSEDFTMNREETLMTTETLETECTTEIELNTPEDKRPMMTTSTTYEERETEPADFISENTESKDTNEPVTPTTSTKYTEDFISTRQETLMTTETLETECTTEIELQTPEDKTPVMTTATHMKKERQSLLISFQKILRQKVQLNQQHQPCPQNTQKISQ